MSLFKLGFKVGKTAAWMTVAVMASLTTLLVLIASVVIASTRLHTQLDTTALALLLLLGVTIALAPWWSLTTVLVARQRR